MTKAEEEKKSSTANYWRRVTAVAWLFTPMNKRENEWILLVELHCEPENINQNCFCNIIYKT